MFKRLRYLDYLLHSAAAQYRAHQHVTEKGDPNGSSDVYKALHQSYIDEFNEDRYFWMKPREYQVK